MSEKGVSRRRKTKSKVSLLLASLLVILSMTVFGSLSYLISSSSVTNTFTPGTVTPGVEEEFDGTMKKNVTIRNEGNSPAYIRAAIVVSWLDEKDNILAVTPVSEGADANYSINLNLSENGWVKIGEYYYYVNPVDAEDATAVLINSCSPIAGKVDGYLSVEILAQSIQTEPASAVEEAWKDVEVIDGKLSKK